jgi:crossover junction endodeoxyribonuclease RusA
VKPKSICLTLPYPPSANRYWRSARGRVFVSKEAKDFKATVRDIAQERGLNSPLAGDVIVDMTVYRPAKRGDLDNSIKVTLDSLKGIAFDDDKQVVQIIAERRDDKDDPRVEIVVSDCPSRP